MADNITTPSVDTQSWNIPSMVSTPMDVQQPNMNTPEPVIPQVVDRSSEIQSFLGSIRYDASTINSKNTTSEWLKGINPGAGKIDITSQVPLTETHELLNDGETWLPKYSSYLQGVDNETRLSKQQSDFEKFVNPLKRFASNTAKGALDIGSFVYGVGASALSGRFDALYDNSMSKYVDDLTAKTNFAYKNYYDEESRNQSLGLNLQTWDKVLGGAEFTARMLTSEALIAAATSGASLPGTFARAGLKAGLLADKASDVAKVMSIGRNISKMMNIATLPERTVAQTGNVARISERFADALGKAANRGKWGERLVQARFAITSPMYEAGFESLHLKKEAEKEFFDHYRNKGTQPTPEEINDFSSKMTGAANAVFVANMGILSVSNLALFGDMLSIKNPLAKSVFSPNNFVKNSIFRMGTEKVAETGLNQAMKAGLWNKAAAYIAPVVKGMAIEGVYEEGSQGIASNTLKNYIQSSYDPEAMKTTANYLDAFSKSFKDQFGTKEGQEEIIIGAIIGGLFGGVGGIRNTAREYKQQEQIAQIQNTGQEFVENFVSNAYTNEQLLSLFGNANRFQNLRDQLETAENEADNLKIASTKAQSFISLLDAYSSVGKEAEFIDMFSSALQGMDNSTLSEMTGLGVDEVQSFKQEQSQNMMELADKYSTAREAGRYIFRPNIGGFTEVDGKKVNSENLASAFAFASTMSHFNEKFAFETYSAFQNKLAQLNASSETIEKLGALGVLKNAQKIEQEKYSQLSQEENKLRLELGRVTKQLNTLTQGEEKTESAQKRMDLSNEMLDIQARISDTASRKEALWKTLTENFYGKMNTTGFATQPDLENFGKQVQDIQDSLDALSVTTEDKLVLEELLSQFNRAHDSYRDFSDLALKLSDPKFAFKTYTGILSGARARTDKSLNEHTLDALMKVYGYNTDLTESLQKAVNENQREVFSEEKLKDNYVPTEEDLNIIKNRLIEKKSLSQREQIFYNKFKSQVDSYKTLSEREPIKDTSSKTEINNLTVRKNLLQKELDNLEQGVYSEELQEKIQKIDSQIQELDDQFDSGDSFNGHAEAIFSNPNVRQNKIIIDGNNYNIVTGMGRAKTLISINGVVIPFYLTSGQAGKGLIPGWYPFFGIGKDGWLNKTDKTDLETYYERYWGTEVAELIRQVAEDLNNNYGTDPNSFKNDSDPTTTVRPISSLNDKVEDFINDSISITPAINDSNARKTLRSNVEQLGSEILNGKENTSSNSLLDTIDSEIQDLENEIKNIENSNTEFEEKKKRTVESQKQSYRQYEYVKPNGNVVIGYLEINKGILQLVNETEIVDIQETTIPLRNINLSKIEGLTEIQEDEILIEGKEVYVNGKIYRLGLKNPTLDESISQDADGNYQVRLQAGNGRMVTLKGSVADMIVYQNLLNKLEENGTTEQIERAIRQAERDSEIERKYEELITKTENRDSTVKQIEEEILRNQQERQNRQSEYTQEVENLQLQKTQEVEQEKINLENEIAVLNGEISTEEKIERISKELAELEIDIVKTGVQDNDPRVQRMLILEEELQSIRKEKFKESFNPEATPSEQLEWIINNIPDLRFQNIDTLASLEKPSQEVIDEYLELSKKRNRNSVDKKRMSELRDLLTPYNLAEGLDLDGLNILDIINLYNQSKNIQEIQQTQNEQLDEQNFQMVNKEATPKNEFSKPNVGLVYDGAYIERQNNIDKIYHVKLTTFLQKALDKGLKPQIVVLNESGRSNEVPQQIIEVTPENVEELGNLYDNKDNIKIDIDQENGLYLKKPKGEVSFHVYGSGILNLIDSVGYRITGQSTGYIQIFDRKTDGTWGGRESEFGVYRDGVELPFDKEELNKIQPGDKVTLEFDPNDDYNKTLQKNQYNSLGNIYVRKNGKLVQILKSTRNKTKTDGQGWEELEAIRKKVVKSKTPVQIEVESSYLGLPIVFIDSDGKAIELPVDESKVAGYGYIDENGELKGDISKSKLTNTQYIDSLKSLKKVSPVFAFKYNGQVIAFPLNLKPKGVNLTQDVDNIINSNMTREQKMFSINSLLEQNQMFTEELALSPANFNITAVKEALSNVYSTIDITDSEQFKDADKYSYVNLDDPFMSSKLVFNFNVLEDEVQESVKASKETFKKTVVTKNKKGLNKSDENKC